MSTACSALWARWVRPSFILVMRASGSYGWVQSSLDPFLGRLRSNFANCSLVGVSIPLSFANRVRNSSYFSPVSRRTIDRSAALASSVVESTPIVVPFSSFFSASTASTPLEYRLMRLDIHQPSGPRDGRVIRHVFIQCDAYERSDRQAVAGAPRDPALRIDPFEVAHHQQSKIDPRSHSWPTHFIRVELLPNRFHILVELLLIQDLIQPLVKRMAHSHRQHRGRDPQPFLPNPLLASSHRHVLKTITTIPRSHS